VLSWGENLYRKLFKGQEVRKIMLYSITSSKMSENQRVTNIYKPFRIDYVINDKRWLRELVNFLDLLRAN
jgi:hypothetical protein